MTLSPQDFENLVLDLESVDETICRTALFRAAKSGDPRVVEPLKAMAGSHGIPEIRYLARKALHFMASQQPQSAAKPARPEIAAGALDTSPEGLGRALASPDAAVRALALRATISTASTDLLPFVVGLIQNETDSEVRSLIPQALGRLGGKSQIPLIARLALKDADSRVRSNAFETLGLPSLRNVDSFAIIVRGLQDSDHRVLSTCIQVLADLGKINLITVCEQMLKSQSLAVRDSAAFCLQQAKFPEAVPLLERAMRNDPHEGVKTKARIGLERLAAAGVAAAKDALARSPDAGRASVSHEFEALESLANGLAQADDAVTSRDVTRRRRATDRIAALGASDAALPHLIARLKDEDDELTLSNLIRAIGRIKNEIATPIVQDFLIHSSPSVRQAAVEALVTIGTESAISLLLPLINDPDPQVVGQVTLVLRKWQFVGPKAVEALARHREPEFRRAAIQVISELDDAASRALLEELSGDDDEETADLAREAARLRAAESEPVAAGEPATPAHDATGIHEPPQPPAQPPVPAPPAPAPIHAAPTAAHAPDDPACCPVCGSPPDPDARSCPACGSILIVTSIESLYADIVDSTPLNTALTRWKARAKVEPGSGAVQYALALVYLNMGETQKALPPLRKATKLDPDLAIAHYTLGVVLYHDGAASRSEFEEATLAMDRAAELDGSLGEATGFQHFFRARQRGTKDRRTALKDYSLAIEACPELPMFRNSLGLCHLEQKSYAEAEKAFESAIQRDPDYLLGHTNLCLLAYTTGRPADGIRHGMRALECVTDATLPHDAALAHNNLALCHFKMGNKADAIRLVKQAIGLSPKDETFRENHATFTRTGLSFSASKQALVLAVLAVLALLALVGFFLRSH